MTSEETQSAHGAELRQIVERFERLDEDRLHIVADQKEVLAEAKGRGFDVRALRRVIALRKRKADDVAEEEAIVEIYKDALGMIKNG